MNQPLNISVAGMALRPLIGELRYEKPSWLLRTNAVTIALASQGGLTQPLSVNGARQAPGIRFPLPMRHSQARRVDGCRFCECTMYVCA